MLARLDANPPTPESLTRLLPLAYEDYDFGKPLTTRFHRGHTAHLATAVRSVVPTKDGPPPDKPSEDSQNTTPNANVAHSDEDDAMRVDNGKQLSFLHIRGCSSGTY